MIGRRFANGDIRRDIPPLLKMTRPTKTLKAKTPTKKDLQEQVRLLQEAMHGTVGVEAAACADQVVQVTLPPTFYSDDMVVTLLELRYGRFKETFSKCNSNQKKCSLWERLRLQFNIIVGGDNAVTTTSLKNKEYDIRAKYKAIRIKEAATGNDSDIPIDYPVYWDDMVAAFGDMRGLGDVEFGDDVPFPTENSGQADKRKAVDDLESQRQKRSKSKVDIGAGLVSLGDALAKGLVDAAAFRSVPDSSIATVATLLAETKEILVSTGVMNERTIAAI
ncbi:hypothetical protein DYB38_006783 [Aphanomyces astaci]|uniref:Myb/SANT-like domain-containing protein n=2 Tax=Aphanomyces astaci TaxID=112090 RepID=A0A397DCL0_APHAT|nr:hypothetical protein DYB38_006783 [Aphanomyces astaci]